MVEPDSMPVFISRSPPLEDTLQRRLARRSEQGHQREIFFRRRCLIKIAERLSRFPIGINVLDARMGISNLPTPVIARRTRPCSPNSLVDGASVVVAPQIHGLSRPQLAPKA